MGSGSGANGLGGAGASFRPGNFADSGKVIIKINPKGLIPKRRKGVRRLK